MANIPPEIWFHIAKFIPNESLPHLLAVNSTFFDIAIDIRYREIVIDTRAIDESMKRLKRSRCILFLSYALLDLCQRFYLSSDPFIASRVHRFALHLLRFPNTRDKVRHQLRRTIRTITRIFQGPESQPVMATLTDLANEIIDTTKKFVNVRELYINYWDPVLSYDPHSLISSVLSSVGPKLHSLSLNGHLESYSKILLKLNPNFDELQELCLNFSGVSVDKVTPPFVNSLAPHLVSLELSWASTRIPAFFFEPAPFAVLKVLTLHIIFDDAFREGSGIKSLICDSSGTLQRVTLRLYSRRDPLSEELLRRWLSECMLDERFFSQVRFLDIFTSVTARIRMEFLLGCIQHSSQSLVELIIGQYLREREIEVVLDALSSCNYLTHLDIYIAIRRLDVTFIDCLALKLPQINRLRLRIAENERYFVCAPHNLDGVRALTIVLA